MDIVDEILAGDASQEGLADGVVDELLGGSQAAKPMPVTAAPVQPDFIDQALAHIAQDPQAIGQYLAEQAGYPADDVVVQDGTIGIKMPDGSIGDLRSGFWQDAGQITGETIGIGLPAGLGAAGAIAALPGGPAAAFGGGTLGAMGGQAIREGLATAITDQEPSLSRIATEGAMEAGGLFAAHLIAKGISKVAASRAGAELNRLIKSGGMKAADATEKVLADINKRYGTDIRLTPAELTSSSRLRSQQMAVANTPEGAEIMTPYLEKRIGENEKAFEMFLGGLSEQADPDLAGANVRRVAEQALDKMKQARNAKGSPAYEKAFAEGGDTDIRPVLQVIDETAALSGKSTRRALREVRDEFFDENGKQITDLELIQNRVKETLDIEIADAVKNGRNKQAASLEKVQRTLLETIDSQNPAYREARQLWEELSRPIDEAGGGIIPKMAKAKPETYTRIAERILPLSSPAEIKRARKLIVTQEGGEEAWDAMVRSYLQAEWAKAGSARVGRHVTDRALQAPKADVGIFKTDAHRDRLKAALDIEQFDALQKLLHVFEAQGRGANLNSTTAAQLEGRKMIESGSLAKSAANMTNPIEAATKASNFITNWLDTRNIEAVAKALTDKDAIKELRKIKKTDTPTFRNLVIWGNVLETVGWGATAPLHE